MLRILSVASLMLVAQVPSMTSLVDAASDSNRTEFKPVAATRRLRDGGSKRNKYVNVNFNDIKGDEGALTEYKGLSFFPFYYFDVSKSSNSKYVPSEMRGKAVRFTEFGSISVSDSDEVFTPESFDISSSGVDQYGYLFCVAAGFRDGSNLPSLLNALPAISARHKSKIDYDANVFMPELDIIALLESNSPSMMQGFTLRGNKAKRIYLDGFDSISHLVIVSMYGRDVASSPPVMLMDNLVYSNMEKGYSSSSGSESPTTEDNLYVEYNFQTVSGTCNLGTSDMISACKISFTTGSEAAPYDRIGAIYLLLQNLAAAGTTFTFLVELRADTFEFFDATLYASDTVSKQFTSTALEEQSFCLPNIAAYPISAATSYSIYVYNSEVSGSTSNSLDLGLNAAVDPFYNHYHGYSNALAFGFGETKGPMGHSLGISLGPPTEALCL